MSNSSTRMRNTQRPAGGFTLRFSRDGVVLGTLSFTEVAANQQITLVVELVDPERLVRVRTFDRHAGALGHFGHRAAMVDVAMRDQYLLQRGAALVQQLEQAVGLAAGVDEGGAVGGGADDQRAVLLEGGDGDDGELQRIQNFPYLR